MLGPVSTALEADLRSWVRRHGVVFWLDLDQHYGGFVQQLAALRAENELPYQVFSFQGSHLELLLQLEPLTGSVDRPQLVVHLPGFKEESVKETPLLELYAAGTRYRKALGTLVAEAAAGQVRPEEVASFQAQPGLTLEQADAWLHTTLQGDGGELAARLRGMSLNDLASFLLSPGPQAPHLAWKATQDALLARMEAASGLPRDWPQEAIRAAMMRTGELDLVLASWALSVEYVNDLRRPPVSRLLAGISELPRQTIDDCCELARYLRSAHATLYARTADETEAWLEDEVAAARAEDLGKIDTFRFEDDKVLEESLGALAQARYQDALQWARLRIEGVSFWLSETPSRRAVWELVRDAALLGLALEAAGPALEAGDLSQAVARYCQQGAAVDLRHRQLEQQREALLYPQLPEFETLRARLDELRGRWRQWADGWARDFNKLCRQEGFLPPAGLQQREIFEEVVRPLTQEHEVTALFMIDAFRYELASELLGSFAGLAATSAHLEARLAELPTITAVGMNVLAPVSQGGSLRPALAKQKVLGFASGEFRVADGETRRRAMQGRVGGATCPLLSLKEVLAREATSLKQSVARARLVIVHSSEFDDAGETDVGPKVFQQLLQDVRAGWRLLREAGVRRFVFTADHGFLLLDPSAAPQRHGRKIDPRRRHVFSEVAADHPGEVRVALADLGYEGVSGQLMFPDSTAVFDTGRQRQGFVHGGNSLQERVIPVLTVQHRAAAGSSTLRYRIEAEAREGVGGMHCLGATVKVALAQTTLDFGAVKELELGLRVVDADTEVQVELCQTRDGAKLAGAAIIAQVGRPFELFFRLLGRTDARVQLELAHSGAQAEVIPGLVEQRFAVALDGRDFRPAAPAAEPQAGSWLEKLPAGGVRELFAHLAAHGAVTELEAAAMLGSQRALRQFARNLEAYAIHPPFAVQIQVVGGIKRYVRDGSDQ